MFRILCSISVLILLQSFIVFASDQSDSDNEGENKEVSCSNDDGECTVTSWSGRCYCSGGMAIDWHGDNFGSNTDTEPPSEDEMERLMDDCQEALEKCSEYSDEQDCSVSRLVHRQTSSLVILLATLL